MKRLFLFRIILSLWLISCGSTTWALDTGWMQQGVRVWYFGAVGATSASDAEEAYLFGPASGANIQVTKHSGLNHWGTTNPIDTSTYPILDKGPCWIHPQTLQNLQSGDTWKGQVISTVIRESLTYTTFKQKFSFPYLLLPIKALFDLKPQRDIVKIVYYISQYSTGIAYFDADTGLMLLYQTSNGYVTIFFLLSEINYDFATHQAFAEDTGPHTGFKSSVLETQLMPFPDNRGGYVFIQSSVESRYGATVQMWVSTSDSGDISSYMPPYESYCFFGDIPLLRRINMTQATNYPPDQWNPYGQHLWWWLSTAALQSTTINVFNVPMSRISTVPYTFIATEPGTGLYFTKLWFDDNGYLTKFAAKDATTGLDIDPDRISLYFTNSTGVDGKNYYQATMGTAIPVPVYYQLTLAVTSDTEGKGGGSVNDGDTIACSGTGSNITGMTGICQRTMIPAGTTIILHQSPDIDSTWGTWGGDGAGCGISSDCSIRITGDTAVSLLFPYAAKIKVHSTDQGYETLTQAYAAAGSADTIYCRAVSFTENILMNGNKAITLLGGRDAWYQPQNAWTTLEGMLTIQGGSLNPERLVVK